MSAETPYDSIVLVSFGGPERKEDVLPFLENVLRGKNVPRERMLEVAEHYYHFDGKSPINDHNRDFLAALREELDGVGIDLPLYWGNRNWHPLLPDTIRQMADDGKKRALAFVTSAFGSYSGCRQYREDIARAREEVGERAPEVDKLRNFFNHPGFIEAMIGRVADAVAELPEAVRGGAKILFTAHSVPLSMAKTSPYVERLEEASRLVAEAVGSENWELVWQSRSGPPQQPWLEPDVCDRMRELHEAGELDGLVIAPIGFLSDHMEVLFDLDTEARELAVELGVPMARAGTVGSHPRFVQGVRELIEERLDETKERAVVGRMAPCGDQCPADCCPKPVRPQARPSA